MPSLVALLTDYRASAPNGDLSHPLESLKPTTQTPISVPYISPLVLRRELETVLDKEGDSCLTTPLLPELHPIIYWNLIYFFHRIAVPSHLPGLLLGQDLPGWADLDYRNVKVVTRWDNESLHQPDMLPLHFQWRKRNCSAVSVEIDRDVSIYLIFCAAGRPQGNAPSHAHRHQRGEGERPQVLRGVHHQREGPQGGRAGLGGDKH